MQSFDSNVFGDGALLGCDFVGEVLELGSDVTRLAKGDVVAGLVWGGKLALNPGSPQDSPPRRRSEGVGRIQPVLSR